MSRAFVKEPDGEEVGTDLPDRPVSAHRNFVTPSGLAQIDGEIERLRASLAEAKARDDKQVIASASRDLRYWTARRASAERVDAPEGDEVRFGSTVTIERGDGRRQTFRITGEDEADPAKGSLSYVSPLARALIGKAAEDEVEFHGDAIAIVRVDQVGPPP